MSRQRVGDHATGSLPRVGGTRDSEIQDLLIPSSDVREIVALGFVCLFAASILIALLLLCLVPFGELFKLG